MESSCLWIQFNASYLAIFWVRPINFPNRPEMCFPGCSAYPCFVYFVFIPYLDKYHVIIWINLISKYYFSSK